MRLITVATLAVIAATSVAEAQQYRGQGRAGEYAPQQRHYVAPPVRQNYGNYNRGYGGGYAHRSPPPRYYGGGRGYYGGAPRYYGGGRGYYYGNNNGNYGGAAVGLGILGAILGGVIVNSQQPYAAPPVQQCYQIEDLDAYGNRFIRTVCP